MRLYAVLWSCLRLAQRKYALLLGALPPSQREGRRSAAELCSASASPAQLARESGLVLHKLKPRPRIFSAGFLHCAVAIVRAV